VAGHLDRSGLAFRPFVPGGHRIASIRNILHLVVPGQIRSGKVGSGCDHHISGHLRMNVAKQWHHSCRVEFERLLLTLWPGAEVMAQLLVAADGSPKDVVSDTVAVKEG